MRPRLDAPSGARRGLSGARAMRAHAVMGRMAAGAAGLRRAATRQQGA